MKLPAELTAQAKRNQEYDRISSQLDAATAAVFGVLKTGKDRNDPALTLEAADRIISLVELRGRLASTFSGADDEGIAKEGVGGDG